MDYCEILLSAAYKFVSVLSFEMNYATSGTFLKTITTKKAHRRRQNCYFVHTETLRRRLTLVLVRVFVSFLEPMLSNMQKLS